MRTAIFDLALLAAPNRSWLLQIVEEGGLQTKIPTEGGEVCVGVPCVNTKYTFLPEGGKATTRPTDFLFRVSHLVVSHVTHVQQ